MRTLALLLAAALLAGCGDDPIELVPKIDEDPFAAQADAGIAGETDLDAVPVAQPVTLRWTAPGFTSFAWTLEVPPGSLAQLSGAGGANPTFTPDVEGVYRVGVTATGGAGARQESRRFTAATYRGLSDCARCHGSRASDFATTDHARASVQCESCHGPGSQHDGDPRRTAVTLRAGLCSTCHDGTVGPDLEAQWQSSDHGRDPPAAALADPSCVRCHTAQGFLASLRGEPAPAQQPGVPGVTCAACHEPHSAANAKQVRVFGTVPLASGGAYNGGRGAACILCHQGEVTDATAQADSGGAFPCAVQADMLTARGAVEYGLTYGTSFHGTTVFRLQPFTGDPDDSDTPDACVVCHMAPSSSDDLGEHAMRQRQGGSTLAAGNCDRCHPGLDTFDRFLGRDFDGNGRAQGVQTEVNGLLSILLAELRNADPNGALDQPGGAGTQIFVDPDLSLSTPALRRAAYNYNFVALDGSLGVHNTTYAIQLVQRTYEQLTGVPFTVAFPDADTP